MSYLNGYPSRRVKEPALLKRNEPVFYGKNRKTDAYLTEEQILSYEDNGFLILPDLLDAEDTQALTDALQSLRRTHAGSEVPEVIREPDSHEVRSIFAPHRLNETFSAIARQPRLLGIAERLLGSQVYLHQSRLNYKPGFCGQEFFWHSDFETWHTEDGMPSMRAVSCSILLSENSSCNGPLLLIPGSHRHFVSCPGETPDDHYRQSLRRQTLGTPDTLSLTLLAEMGGLVAATGTPGTVVFFDCNTMHASSGNLSPQARSNAFFVYNSVENTLQAPQHGLQPRPDFIANRSDLAPLTPVSPARTTGAIPALA